MQLTQLFSKFDELHAIHGSKSRTAIYGAGQIDNPDICLIFMNPTAKNVSSSVDWKGIKAPWLGTKNVWRLLYKLNIFKNKELLDAILSMRPEEWTVEFAENLYKEISNTSLYITNIAKCTQEDAKHLSDSIYKDYLATMLEELEIIKPKAIIAMGNQVNSVLLNKPVSVSKYLNQEFEELILPSGLKIKLFPTYYPIGQGTRNIAKAMVRIENIIGNIARS